MTSSEPSSIKTVRVTLRNQNGLHARPAHLFVQTANRFEASLSVSREGLDAVDGKSIMGVMMLAAEKGTTLELSAEGEDAEAQLDALRELVEGGFGES